LPRRSRPGDASQDRESRVVGKAAIDVVAYRLAKSGGSVVLQAVLVVFGSLDDTGLFPIGLVFSLVVVVWLRAALATGRLVHEAQRVENLDLHGAVHRVVI
jgi:ATP/ADP translocase